MSEVAITFVGKDQVSGVMSKIAGGFSSFGKTAALGVVGAFAGVAAGLGAAVASSVNTASQIQTAQKEIQAELGVTESVAKQLGAVATEVFKSNFGDSINEAKTAVVEAQRQLAQFGLSNEALQKVTEGAFALRDVFGAEIGGSEGVISATNVLMSKFGLTGQQALDFITAGFQDGLNSSDDFLASVTEYGVLFGSGKATADQFFSTLKTGLQSGVLGTDKVADAFKEFQIRFIEGNKDLSEGLGTLGLDYGQLRAQVERGQITVVEAFGKTAAAAAGVDLSILSNKKAVAKLGTQFEDMGAEAFAAINLGSTSLAQQAGATERLGVKYDNLGSLFEEIWRRFQIAIAPIGAKILELGNTFIPIVRDSFERLEPVITNFADSIGNVIELMVTGDFSGGIFGLHEDHPFIGFLLSAREFGLKFAEYLKDVLPSAITTAGAFLQTTLIPAFSGITDFISNSLLPILSEFGAWLAENLPPFLEDAKTAFEKFKTNTLPVIVEFVESVKKWFADLVGKAQPIIEAFTDRFQEVWEQAGPVVIDALARIGDAYNEIIEVFGITQSETESTSDAIITNLQQVLDAIVIAVQAVAVVLQGVAWGMEKISTVTKFASDQFDKFGQIMSGIESKIPTVLRPGSPPPLAVAMSDIANASIFAAKSMNSFGNIKVGGFSQMSGGIMSITDAFAKMNETVPKTINMTSSFLQETGRMTGGLFTGDLAKSESTGIGILDQFVNQRELATRALVEKGGQLAEIFDENIRMDIGKKLGLDRAVITGGANALFQKVGREQGEELWMQWHQQIREFVQDRNDELIAATVSEQRAGVASSTITTNAKSVISDKINDALSGVRKKIEEAAFAQIGGFIEPLSDQISAITSAQVARETALTEAKYLADQMAMAGKTAAEQNQALGDFLGERNLTLFDFFNPDQASAELEKLQQKALGQISKIDIDSILAGGDFGGIFSKAGSNQNVNNNNNQQMTLNINSSAPTENLAADFNMMQASLAPVP